MSTEWRGVCARCGAHLTRMSKQEDRPECFEEHCFAARHDGIEPCAGTVVMTRLPAFD